MNRTGLDIKRTHTVKVRVITASPKRNATAAVVWPAPAHLVEPTAMRAEYTATVITVQSSRVRTHMKTFFVAFATAIAVFGFSIATSEVMAHMSPSTDGMLSSAVAGQPLADASIRQKSTPLVVTGTPSTLALSAAIITDPNAIYLPQEQIDAPDPLTERKAFLTTYLASKHSPLAAHVDALSEQTQWKLIIAISNSESSYCKRMELNNCWGIGGAWNLKAYTNYDQAIADVNQLLERKYIAAGLTSPDTIEGKWVGYSDQNWQEAANQVMDDLKNVQ
jgi:hypothetical protein